MYFLVKVAKGTAPKCKDHFDIGQRSNWKDEYFKTLNDAYLSLEYKTKNTYGGCGCVSEVVEKR